MSDDFDDLYGSKYMGAADLKGKKRRATISETDVADFKEKNGNTKRKYVLHFEDEPKAMVLNKTNAQRLGEVYGKNRKSWIGRTVELYSETTSFGEGLRLRPTASDEMDDEIPDLAARRA